MNDEKDRMVPPFSAKEEDRESPTEPKTTQPEKQIGGSRASSDQAKRGGESHSGPKKGEHTNGARINSDDEDSSPQKKARQQKPTSTEFVERVKQAISTTPSIIGLKSLQKLLTMGVKAKSPVGPLINELFALLKDWPESSRLALYLCTQTRTKRSSDLIRGLKNRLTDHSRSVVGYPEVPESVADSEQLIEIVSEWLGRHLTKESGAGEDEQVGMSDLNWVRWAAVCLMDGPLIVRTEGIYRLLEAFCLRHRSIDRREAETLFSSEVGSLLGADKPNARKIVSELNLAAGGRDLGDTTRSQLQVARGTISKKNARIDELEGINKTLTDSLARATARIIDLEAQVMQKAQQVEQQKAERNLDREHLETLADQRLTRTMNDFSGRLSHEVAEAKICLDGEAPNVRMALDRLRQMEWVLAKMRGA